MKRRVFWSIMLTSLLTLILTSVLLTTALYNDFVAERKQVIIGECAYIAAAVQKTDTDFLTTVGRNSSNRITLVSSDGTVLYDNVADIATLDNHIDRPEIAAAIQKGSGESTRLSDTLGQRNYYYALRLTNGNILRVSTTTRSVIGIIDETATYIFLIILFAMISAIIAAHFLTKAIIAPINRLNLDAPLTNNTYEELSTLLVKMDRQNKKIFEQIEELESKQNEFNAITKNMSEALVIFGEKKQILSANTSAKKLFGVIKAKNLSYLELYRDVGYTRSVEAAFLGEPSSVKINKNGRIYQLSVNPVKSNNNYAAVMFAVDITEREQNEKMRREFSANVSHELKTPLTSIIGCAEIMHNGIARKEDFPSFIEQIYVQSKRLLTLIEDIIKLSRLDEEGVKNEFNDVDLYELSKRVISELSDKASANSIELILEGEKHIISGNERILHEMIFNLCDNAIIYNKAHGNVIISITKNDSFVVFSIEDTGIGIASEHQARIFERFYRVDKSRSKETGGTGLGLSIVKHGVKLHNAEITLESRVGEGTHITIRFKSII
ncbi:MAG: PAS domain-containing sensor histidine kinase [Firmicutes bacterium HGW-Firmicutes-21]|nr:MAG: PAS domain-containing sensor histidine kinase [Firmicutes bacterium HGW-Firmicutes-21]